MATTSLAFSLVASFWKLFQDLEILCSSREKLILVVESAPGLDTKLTYAFRIIL
jgi:hypothetical protein